MALSERENSWNAKKSETGSLEFCCKSLPSPFTISVLSQEFAATFMRRGDLGADMKGEAMAVDQIFLKQCEKRHSAFSWDGLGDIKEGRGALGEDMPVLVYRLMQYTMLDVLSREFGEEKANGFFRSAGFLAGSEFARNALDLKAEFSQFLAILQKALADLKIGILRMESFDAESGEMTMTVSEDLDCSGLPVTNENVCSYDEGFISGILEAYTGKKYDVREVDCWSSGDRVCRFKGTVTA
jgi:predicted hydrocarbon binding protein